MAFNINPLNGRFRSEKHLVNINLDSGTVDQREGSYMHVLYSPSLLYRQTRLRRHAEEYHFYKRRGLSEFVRDEFGAHFE